MNKTLFSLISNKIINEIKVPDNIHVFIGDTTVTLKMSGKRKEFFFNIHSELDADHVLAKHGSRTESRILSPREMGEYSSFCVYCYNFYESFVEKFTEKLKLIEKL